VNASFTSDDDVGRRQQRQILQPQARCLRLTVTEHPRLDDLIRLAPVRREHADWVLHRYPRDVRLDKIAHEFERFSLKSDSVLEPTGTTDGNVGAGWEADHHVPRAALSYRREDVASDVVRRIPARALDVARNGIVSAGAERVTDSCTFFTAYENSHCKNPSAEGSGQ
jgi:hypothetical protein